MIQLFNGDNMFDNDKLEQLRALLPGEEVTVDESEYVFIYGERYRDDADLYLIFSGGHTTVHHQYNCVCCDQFESANCALVAVNGPLAKRLSSTMRCSSDGQEIASVLREWLPDANVPDWPSESLVSVESATLGSFYLANCNCD